jgi:UDP-N-acetylmuramyl-tripeptide synthetase
VAIAGARTDGHRFVEQAIRGGATVVIHEAGRDLGLDESVRACVDLVAVRDPRQVASRLAPLFHGRPADRMRVVAVTGTNGKTTTAHLLESLSAALGRRAGMVSSLGIRWGGRVLRLDNVVPEPVLLHRTLARMRHDGVDALVLEVSSYALLAGRIDGIDLDAAVLTNVTRDHLDVHGTMEAYVLAKLRLFDRLRDGPRARACIWHGCEPFDAVWRRVEPRPFAKALFGVDERAIEGARGGGVRLGDRLGAANVRLGWDGTCFDLVWNGARAAGWRTRLLGRFNVLNVLAALSTEPELLDRLASGDHRARDLLAGVLRDVTVPGRLEPIANDRGVRIFVDYAHTDDGLRQVLGTLRALPHRRLVTVFGCGGERDRGKRPLMGRVASETSDLVVLTSDNPRTEDPEAILRDIEAGIAPGRSFRVVPDREQAIREVLSRVEEGDILLVAGKGHEDRQIVGTTATAFHDGDIIRKHL